jgi:hypothetical protein
MIVMIITTTMSVMLITLFLSSSSSSAPSLSSSSSSSWPLTRQVQSSVAKAQSAAAVVEEQIRHQGESQSPATTGARKRMGERGCS